MDGQEVGKLNVRPVGYDDLLDDVNRHFVGLGLARGAGLALQVEELLLADADHALAGGIGGQLPARPGGSELLV